MNLTEQRISFVCSAFLLLLAVPLVGCEQGKYPFLMVQICLGDESNLAAFTREMQSIAAAEKMRFVDASNQVKRDLDVVNRVGATHEATGPVFEIAVRRKDGSGVSAGNLGLPGYQVALGFSEGSNHDEAREFARRVVTRLEKQWRVEQVPQGQGAQPMKDCDSRTQLPY